MHLVIGANGRVGRLVTQELINAGEKPRVFVRSAKKTTERFGNQVDTVVGDLNDPDTIKEAMKNASSVFLCSPIDPDQVRQQNQVVDAASRAQAYLVKVSGLATFPGSFVDSGRWHAMTEQHMAQTEISGTCLHPFFFMQNMDFQLPGILRDGVLKSAVIQAAIAMVDTGDIAAVAAKLMLNPDLAMGQTLPLTCSEALSYEQMASEMSEVFGHTVRFETQNPQQVAANLRQSGMPDWHINVILQFNRAFNEGLGSKVHSHVQDILGRPAVSFRQYLETATISVDDANPFPS